METWEKLLLGVFAILIIFLFRPGLKAAFERSQRAEHKDWAGLLVPLVLVVLFVMLLIYLT